MPRVDCDIDFEELANEWIDNIINELGDQEVKQVVQDAQNEPIQMMSLLQFIHAQIHLKQKY